MRIRWQAPDVETERQFERDNVLAKRESYLRTNPLQRYEDDTAYRAKVEVIRSWLGEPSGRVLDVGGNTGGEATVLQQLGYRMVVGDINEAALDISRERVGTFGLESPDYVAFDAHCMPFADNSFTVVAIVEALHHMVDYGQVLSEALRVLKPGGRLVSMEPNALNPIRRAGEVRDRFRGTIEKSFYPWQARRLCLDAGFVDVKVEGFGIDKPEWKKREVPAYRRWLFKLHCELGVALPDVFGSLAIEARKAGELGEDSGSSGLDSILQIPGGGAALKQDPVGGGWIGGDEEFEDLNGIPVIIR